MARYEKLPQDIIIGVVIPGGDGALETCLETKNHVA